MGTAIGLIKGETRSLDYSSYGWLEGLEVPFWGFLEEVLCILSTVDAGNHECHQIFYDPGVTVLSTGLFEATSPDITLNGAL